MTKTDNWSEAFAPPRRDLPPPPARRTSATAPTGPSTLVADPAADDEVTENQGPVDNSPDGPTAPTPTAERSTELPAPPASNLSAASSGKHARIKPLSVGMNLSYKEYTAQKEAAQWTDRVLAALSKGGLRTTAQSAKLDKDLFTVELVTANAAALMSALPAVVDEFECDDLDVALIDDSYVRLRLPTRKGNAEQRAVWVPTELRELVRNRTAVTRESVTDVFMRAFNDLYDQMDTWFAAPTTDVAGPMVVSGRRRREGVGDQVQLYLYLTPIARARLEDAVETSHAGSRSALVTELLQRHLSD